MARRALRVRGAQGVVVAAPGGGGGGDDDEAAVAAVGVELGGVAAVRRLAPGPRARRLVRDVAVPPAYSMRLQHEIRVSGLQLSAGSSQEPAPDVWYVMEPFHLCINAKLGACRVNGTSSQNWPGVRSA